MVDLIDRKALLETLNPNYLEGKKLIENGETHLDNLAEGYLECSELIRLAPTVEPKKGEWLWDAIRGGWRCSVCEKFADNDYLIVGICDEERKPRFPHCPNCGAKMRGENK